MDYFAILNEIKAHAEKHAGEVTSHQEDFCADDYAGGNIDDAWERGMDDGCADMANDILGILDKHGF